MHSKLSVRGNNHQFIRRLFKQFTTSSTLFLWVCMCAQKPCMHDKERRGTFIIDKMLYIPVHLCVYVCAHGYAYMRAPVNLQPQVNGGEYFNKVFTTITTSMHDVLRRCYFFVQLYGKFCYILAGQKIQTFPWYIMHWWLNNEIKLDPFTNNPILLVIDLWRKKRWIKINAAYHSFFSFLWGWGLDVWGEKHQAAVLRHHEVCWIK